MKPSSQQPPPPIAQPMSHHSLQTPLSNQSIQAPMSNAPATPQQFHQQQQAHLQAGMGQHHLQQQQGPHSSSTGPGVHISPNQQHQLPPQHQIFTETDPVAAARMLILRDLRKAIQEVNVSAERLVSEHFLAPNTSTGKEEERKAPTSIAQPHSNNPLSVNPHSEHGPQSVNAPNSVKSADEKPTVAAIAAIAEGATPKSSKEQYSGAMNNFLNVCDDVEKNLSVLLEVQRQLTRFEATSSLRTPSDAINFSYPQLIQPYVNQMLEDKRVLGEGIQDISQLLARLQARQSVNVTNGGDVEMEEQ